MTLQIHTTLFASISVALAALASVACGTQASTTSLKSEKKASADQAKVESIPVRVPADVTLSEFCEIAQGIYFQDGERTVFHVREKAIALPPLAEPPHTYSVQKGSTLKTNSVECDDAQVAIAMDYDLKLLRFDAEGGAAESREAFTLDDRYTPTEDGRGLQLATTYSRADGEVLGVDEFIVVAATPHHVAYAQQIPLPLVALIGPEDTAAIAQTLQGWNAEVDVSALHVTVDTIMNVRRSLEKIELQLVSKAHIKAGELLLPPVSFYDLLDYTTDLDDALRAGEEAPDYNPARDLVEHVEQWVERQRR